MWKYPFTATHPQPALSVTSLVVFKSLDAYPSQLLVMEDVFLSMLINSLT